MWAVPCPAPGCHLQQSRFGVKEGGWGRVPEKSTSPNAAGAGSASHDHTVFKQGHRY